MQWYNTLLRHRHGCRVRTVLMLLRKQADSSRLDGVYRDQFPGEAPYLEFRYQVLRLWQVPVGTILTGGLGTLPLAPLGDVPQADLPGVLRAMDERVAREATPEQAEILWTAAYVMSGLRLSPDDTAQLFQGVRFMSILEDSSVYQIILEKGAIKELRKTLLAQGRKKFGGPPDEASVAALEAITNLARLERMSERLLEVNTWAELLATP